jgi:hypothetical protein
MRPISRPMDNDSPSTSSSAKRFRLDVASTVSGPVLQEDEFNKLVGEIQKEWEGKQTVAVLKLLMSSTRTNRQSWVKTSDMEAIITAFPCLAEGSFVSNINNPYQLKHMHRCFPHVQKGGTYSPSLPVLKHFETLTVYSSYCTDDLYIGILSQIVLCI